MYVPCLLHLSHHCQEDVLPACVNILVFMILILWETGLGFVDLTMMHFENDSKKQRKAGSILWLKETEKQWRYFNSSFWQEESKTEMHKSLYLDCLRIKRWEKPDSLAWPREEEAEETEVQRRKMVLAPSPSLLSYHLYKD